ncbi:MAG: ribonuclease R, partial [Bosea sp. (in: a-proteobacteria)]
SWRLGDRVQVKLVEAAPVAGALRFELLSEGRKVTPGKAGGGRRFPLSRRGNGTGFSPGGKGPAGKPKSARSGKGAGRNKRRG